MVKTSVFFICVVMFCNLCAMEVPSLEQLAMKFPSLKQLAIDSYIKNAEAQLLLAKKNCDSYKKQCDLIKDEMLKLPYDFGSEIALRFIYTAQNFQLASMKVLVKDLKQRAGIYQNFLYERLFIELDTYLSTLQSWTNFPLIKHKALFMKAFQRKDTLTVERLLGYGVNPNGTWPVDSFLSLAVKDNLYNIATVLIEYGANVNPRYGAHPLYYASLNNNKDMVALLLKKGSDPHSKYRANANDSVFVKLSLLLEHSPVAIRDKYAQAIQLLNE